MCGRFSLTTPAEELAQAFGLEALPPEHRPRYNIAPSQPILAVIADSTVEKRRAVSLRWGFRIQGARGPHLLINARSETAHTLPAFRESFRNRRCLIAASGFYEWAPTAGRRSQPYHVCRQDGRAFALAGLWREGVAADETATCVILTTVPNSVLASIHDRMPVILDPADFDFWLTSNGVESAQLVRLLRPSPAEDLTAFPVGPAVNDARHDTPECVQPLMV